MRAGGRQTDVPPGATMIKFDHLPPTNRALILATLDLEIAEAHCKNIFVLAHKRHQSIHKLWHDVCRKTGQPDCEIPAPLIAPDQGSESATAAHLDSTTASPPLEASTALPAATSSLKGGNVNAGSGHRAQNLGVPLVAGALALLALGVGLLVLVASPNSAVAPQASSQMSNAKRGDVVRDNSGASKGQTDRTAGRTPPPDKPEFDPDSLPPPQGTIRRMEAISKAFQK